MKLLVGLGNPGEKYESTRHNAGFMVIDQLFKDLEANSASWTPNDKLKSHIASVTMKTPEGDEQIILAKPQTFMNNSGQAVSLLANFYKVEPADIWIVYDELDLPLGHLKIRNGGAAAGHHGVESIMESLGTDKFWRFRLGIGHSHNKEKAIAGQYIRDAREYVLESFSKSDQGKVRELIKHGSHALELSLKKGIEAAMNQIHTK